MVDYKKIEAFYKNKVVLITGDTGFKGSWLAFWLETLGARVVGYALPPKRKEDHYNLLNLKRSVRHIDANLLDAQKLKATFKKHQPEIVFHLAAQALVRESYQDPKSTFDTNGGGSVNLLEAVRSCDSVRSVVYVTSDKCYKNKEWTWGYRENDELGGYDPYSASKAIAEIILSSYQNSFFNSNPNIGVASVRAGNVIGGGDWSGDRIVPDCVKAIKDGRAIVLRNPLATRPWQHVLEPLSGYLLLGMKLYSDPHKYRGPWNFGPNITSIRTVHKLTQSMVSHFGSGIIKTNSKRDQKHESQLLHLNCDKANIELNWHATWDFETTMEQTATWYKGYFKKSSARILSENNILKFIKDGKGN